jgi:hypothetical protein
VATDQASRGLAEATGGGAWVAGAARSWREHYVAKRCQAPSRLLALGVAVLGPGAWHRLAATEAALAPLVLGQGLLERRPREVRPQLVAEDELGIGALPEEVVRDSLLA